MTIPWLMKCGHSKDGWCLDCVKKLGEENLKLYMAIVAHRSQKADDRCIEDDDRLYEALGDGIKCDRRVGDKEAMLANCKRFIENRCEGGGPWKNYAELEAENKRLEKQVVEMEKVIADSWQLRLG